MNIEHLMPWRIIRRKYAQFRKRFFTVSMPNGKPYVKTDATIAELEDIFGVRSYSPNSEFSYNYEGEDLNLAHVVNVYSARFPRDSHVVAEPDVKNQKFPWFQVHVRAWEVDGVDGSVIHAHWEPEPTEHADGHLDGDGYSDAIGMRTVQRILGSEGYSAQKFEWSEEQLNAL